MGVVGITQTLKCDHTMLCRAALCIYNMGAAAAAIESQFVYFSRLLYVYTVYNIHIYTDNIHRHMTTTLTDSLNLEISVNVLDLIPVL